MRRAKSVAEAARAVHRARKELLAAHRRLAELTTPDNASAAYVDPAWSWARRLLSERSGPLASLAGVVGTGLGYRQRGGLRTAEPTLVIYVDQKLPPEALARAGRKPLPRSLGSRGRRIGVDVIELRDFRRHVQIGAACGPTGSQAKGTLGAFGVDLVSQQPVAVTAMHVVGAGELPPGTQPPVSLWAEGATGEVLGEVMQGTLSGIDAVKIRVATAQDATRDIPHIGTLKGWRPMTNPGDRDTLVRMYGATSGYLWGHITEPEVDIPSQNLSSAILAKLGEQGTRDGDSGAALVDMQGFVLGFLVGSALVAQERVSIFCPAGLVLSRLSLDIPTL
jgi:hypothetical protein